MREYKIQVIREIALIEEERKRISEDLHDDLGSILASVRLGLESVNEKNPSITGISTTINHLDHTIIRLKEISHNLMPAILQQKGLGAAIEEIVLEIKSSKRFKVSLDMDCNDEEFLPEKTILIFRVIQEILTNILKHSNASQLHISYHKKNESIFLNIMDNGIGFQTNSKKEIKKKFGLNNIRSRLELLEAKYSLQSTMGQGTSYRIEIPLLSFIEGHEKNNTH